MPATIPGEVMQRAQLEFLARITPEQLAREIQGSRFACSSCGACCRSSRVEAGTSQAAAASLVLGAGLLLPESQSGEELIYHTNKLIVDGPEVRRIAEATGRDFFDMARPAPTQQFDLDGVAHSLMWVLRYKADGLGLGDCMFYDANDGRCAIYRHRPAVCREFPFMFELDERDVQLACACPRGTRSGMSEGKAMEYATGVLEWYQTYCNLRYAFENLHLALDPGQSKARHEAGWQSFRRHAEQGYALYSVLDSEGLHRVRARLKDGQPERFELM